LLEAFLFQVHDSWINLNPPMKDAIYLSRSFVEFGPFTTAEVQEFHKRGILKDSDYISSSTGGEWLHVNEWVATSKAPADPKPAPAKPAPAKTAAKAPAAAPAKKAAKKAPKKG
jgi:hypothetical protein